MKVEIPEPLSLFIEEQVRAGHYSSADDVVSRALILMMDQMAYLSENRESVAAQIESGLLSVEREGALDGDAVFDEIEARFQKNG